MSRHCDVTGEPKTTCECGCEPDEGDTPPGPFAIRFQSPDSDGSTPP